LSSMATKDDLIGMASKDDLSGLATKDNIENLAANVQHLETKLNENGNKIDRNFKQIANNTEQLHELNSNSVRLEKIMETLSIRSIEQEGRIRNMTIPTDYTPSNNS